MKRLSLGLLVIACVLSLAGIASAQDAQTPAAICESAVPASEPETRQFAQAEQVLEPGVDYRAIFCTVSGAIYVDLLEDYAPVTVNSFVFLAQQGYYNNTTFHRVYHDFMAQGGDPTGTGSGSPGYQFQDEFVGFLTFDRPGWLAMANANRPDAGIVGTNGSQFFITYVPTPHLDFRHTIFGEVLEGQENTLAIPERDPDTASEPGGALDTVVIITDPAAVQTTYTAPERAAQEDVVAALNTINDLIPPELTHTLTQQTSEEVAASAPEAEREAAAEFLAAHHHEYRVSSAVTGCALETFPAMEMRYTLDSFATREDAAAALQDPFVGELEAGMGLTEETSDVLPNPVYTETTTVCDVPAIHGATRWQRGHFVVTAEVTIPADTPAAPDLWLADIVGTRLFEPIVADVLRREIRSS